MSDRERLRAMRLSGFLPVTSIHLCPAVGAVMSKLRDKIISSVTLRANDDSTPILNPPPMHHRRNVSDRNILYERYRVQPSHSSIFCFPERRSPLNVFSHFQHLRPSSHRSWGSILEAIVLASGHRNKCLPCKRYTASRTILRRQTRYRRHQSRFLKASTPHVPPAQRQR